MVQQTVYGVTNDHNALAINTVNHLECEVKIVNDFHGWIDNIHG